MKKRLLSILTITTLTTTSWADITSEQLDKYLKASGADVMLNQMQEQMSGSIQQRLKMEGRSIPSDVLEEMTKVIVNEENLAKFTESLKLLDEKDYNELMKFYASNLGKKSADLIRNTDMVKMQTEIVEFSKKTIPEDRKKLLAKLAKASMSEERKMNMTRTMMMSTINAMPKEMQETMKERIEAKLEQMKPMLNQQIALISAYTYRDYSNTEIEKMTKHYESSSTQAEVKAIMKGASSYMSTIMPQLIKVIKNKASNAKSKLTCVNMKSVSNSLQMFRLDNNTYPTTKEGLKALVENPNKERYPNYPKTGYLTKIPTDAWGLVFTYQRNNDKFELISYGSDKQKDGSGEAGDIYLSNCK